MMNKDELVNFIHQMKKDGYGVIDNFLPSDVFKELNEFLIPQLTISEKNKEKINHGLAGQIFF